MFGAEPIEVQALGSSNPGRNLQMDYDTVAVNMKFPQDRVASVVVGTKGNDRRTGASSTRCISRRDHCRSFVQPRQGGGDEEEKKKHFPKVDQFGGETEYFSDCILKNVVPEPNGEEGLMDVGVVYAIKQSFESGKPVQLESRDRLRRAQTD